MTNAPFSSKSVDDHSVSLWRMSKEFVGIIMVILFYEILVQFMLS